MSNKTTIIKFTKKQERRFFNTYQKEVERQLQKPSMQAFKDNVNIYGKKDFNRFTQVFNRYMQDRYTDIAEGKRKTVGNYMRDFVNDTKFTFSSKQAKALAKGFKNIEDYSDDFGYDLNQQIEDITDYFEEKTKNLKYSEKINLLRSDLFNILNEDAGALSSINETLKEMGEDAQQQLDEIMMEYGYLDESDPEVKKLLDMAKYKDSYTRSSYIGNRLFGSPT